MILTMNNFTFNQQHYLQIHGTAMGTKMAPSFANLFLGMFETNALTNAPWQPQTWWRYIDDILMIWTEASDRLKIFLDYLNNIHPTIKFTSSHSLTNVPLLDVMVSLHNVSVKSKLQHSPPPRATPWAFDFFENYCSNSPLPRPKCRSNAPHYGPFR